MGDLFGSYADCLHGPGSMDWLVQHSGAWDEMFESCGHVDSLSPRPHYVPLHDVLGTLSAEDYGARCVARDRSFRDQGITFSLSGEQRPFPLDLVPRVIPAEEWQVIERAWRSGCEPSRRSWPTSTGPRRYWPTGAAAPAGPLLDPFPPRSGPPFPSERRAHPGGRHRPRPRRPGPLPCAGGQPADSLGHLLRVENRRAMTHVFPELFASYRVRAVADYPAYLLAALRAAAPTPRRRQPDGRRAHPRASTIRPTSSTPSWPGKWAWRWSKGATWCVGTALFTCARRRAKNASTSIYRRVDDEFLDPLQFLPSSLLGCPGVLNAARAGNVTLANAVGNGVADDKALYPRVPDLIRYYLGEEPDPRQRRHLPARGP